MPFCKNDAGQLLVAPNFVHAPTFSLLVEKKDEYTYPRDGWSWFDTEAEAYATFGIEPVTIGSHGDLI